MDKSHDDNLNANGGSAQPNSGATPLPSSNPAPTSAASNQNSANRNNVAFKSDYIGQWAAKQDNPFAEQNRKAAEKKAAQDAARKKAMPFVKIGAIAAAVIAIIVVIVVVVINVTKPTPIAELTPEESTSFQEEAQKIFDKHTENINLEDTENLTDKEKEDIQKAIEEVGKYYEQQADRASNDAAFVQITLDEMMFYLWNNQTYAAIAAAEKIQADTLSLEQQTGYYSLLQNAYYMLGDYAQADHFFELMRKAAGDTYVEG